MNSFAIFLCIVWIVCGVATIWTKDKQANALGVALAITLIAGFGYVLMHH